MNIGFRSKREKESKEKREEERVNGTKKMRTEGEMQSFSVGKHGIHTARRAARGTAALEGRATNVRRGSTALHPP